MIFWIIIATMLLGDVLWGVLTFRRVRRPWLRVAAAAWAVLQLLTMMVLFGSRGGLADIAELVWRPVWSAVFVWHLIFLPLWLLVNLARGLMALARAISRMERKAEPARDGGMSRREFIGVAAAYTPPMLSVGAGILAEGQLDDFRIRKIEVPLADLPEALDGLSIAHVTDVHVGRFTRGKVLERIVEETNRLNADVIALTGDLINDSLRALPPALEMVRGFRARHIVASCEGNHDLIENGKTFYREAERGGLPLLRDETTTVTIHGHRVQILGLPWVREGQGFKESIRKLVEKRDPAAWHLMLAHHPHAWEHADEIPMTLAGHTHGGQLMLSERAGAGPMMYRYWSGRYTRGKNALVVSNGTGNWFPVRINAPAEIIHIILKRGAQTA
jgi:uncharacterized protein